MPLYWYTDKQIAGKYRLKKPIPVEINVPYTGYTNVKMFGMTFDPSEKYDEISVEAFSRQLKGEIDYNDPLMRNIKPIHDEFNKRIMEYLEEVK